MLLTIWLLNIKAVLASLADMNLTTYDILIHKIQIQKVFFFSEQT